MTQQDSLVLKRVTWDTELLACQHCGSQLIWAMSGSTWNKGDTRWRQAADGTTNNWLLAKKNLTSCLASTHTAKQTQAVYHMGPNFSRASMRSASTTASHRPLTWTTGLGEMRWESSPLSWNTPGCSSCRVRTSPHPVTFSGTGTEVPRHFCTFVNWHNFHECEKSKSALRMDQEVRMSRFLNGFSAVTYFSRILFQGWWHDSSLLIQLSPGEKGEASLTLSQPAR